MIKEGSLSLDNSSKRFSSITERLDGNAFAENVAQGQKTAHEVVSAWLNSDGHRMNIEGNYNLTDISAKRDEKGEYFYTQIFTQK